MIKEEIFRHKHFVYDKLLVFGFKQIDNTYQYYTDIMNGAFSVELVLDAQNKMRSSVIDNVNNEEYIQLKSKIFNGSYVNSVRNEYFKLLSLIAEKCCTEVYFISKQANRISELILDEYKVIPDFPFESNQYYRHGVFRHFDSGKWFALIMNIKQKLLLRNSDESNIDVINLKVYSKEIDELIKREGIFPAYHMNHKNWISIILDDRIDDNEIMEFIRKSFELTSTKTKK